jgi:hypothetical protein
VGDAVMIFYNLLEIMRLLNRAFRPKKGFSATLKAWDLKEGAMDFSLLGFDALVRSYNIHPAFVHFPLTLFPVALQASAGHVDSPEQLEPSTDTNRFTVSCSGG